MPKQTKDKSDAKPRWALRIKQARQLRKWSQEELGRRVGVHRQAVNEWESGKYAPKNHAGQLCEELEFDYFDFWGMLTEDE